MQLLPCVFCGLRPENEFTFDGEARGARPIPSMTDQQTWADYLYFRNNPKGRSLEHWIHSGGCGQWLVIERDTVTHEAFHASLPCGDLDRTKEA